MEDHTTSRASRAATRDHSLAAGEAVPDDAIIRLKLDVVSGFAGAYCVASRPALERLLVWSDAVANSPPRGPGADLLAAARQTVAECRRRGFHLMPRDKANGAIPEFIELLEDAIDAAMERQP